MADESLREELAEVAASVRELLRWEETLGGGGIPPGEGRPIEAGSAVDREPGEGRPIEAGSAVDREPGEGRPIEAGPAVDREPGEAGSAVQQEAGSADAEGAPERAAEKEAAPGRAKDAAAEPASSSTGPPASAQETSSEEPSAEQASLFEDGRRRRGPSRRRPPAKAPAPAEPQLEKLEPEERQRRLATLQEQAASCTKCGLHEGRTNSVFARGSAEAELVFVGEGPGYYEDQQGLPFVGRAGQLLDRMIQAMGYAPDEVYICNVIKCRPPENRTPLPNEAAACLPYLEGQLEAIAPKAMVALGRTAAEHLGCLERGAKGWRGRWRSWRGVPVMPTYHPAFLLRSPQFKRQVWEDLQQVMQRLGKEPPQRKR